MDDRRFSRVFPLAGQVVHQYMDNVSRVLFCMEKKKAGECSVNGDGGKERLRGQC